MSTSERHKRVARKFEEWLSTHAYFSIEHQARVFNRIADKEYERADRPMVVKKKKVPV